MGGVLYWSGRKGGGGLERAGEKGGRGFALTVKGPSWRGIDTIEKG